MRARSPLAPLLAALAAGVLLGACGSGLYDATGVPQVDGGGGDTCGLDQVRCGVDSVCTAQGATACGVDCTDCTATGTAPPNGVRECLREGGVPGTCGYVCTDGYLKCATGCCGATALVGGERFSCALLDDGEVACWGANEAGQVGGGTTGASRPAPGLVPLSAAAIAIAAGTSHACAVLQGGAVWCWGANDAGQVTGTAGALPVLSPAPAPAANAVAVAAGAAHTCALLAGGAIVCWGANASGQLGPGPGQPIATGATAVAAGLSHTCALVGGAVRCWGANGAGQLGATPVSGIATPIGSGVQQLAAGGDQTCAGKPSNNSSLDDALRCWGDSVGSGWLLAPQQTTPAIPRKDASTATIRYDVGRVAAGAHHVCVQKPAEAVECLGANDAGQLGGALPGAGDRVTVPLPPTVPGAVALAAGASHACAALGDGRLRCWGANDSGQLGDGSTAQPGVGTLVTPLGR